MRGQFPDIHAIARSALFIKLACAASGAWLAAVYLQSAATWQPTRRATVWTLLLVSASPPCRQRPFCAGSPDHFAPVAVDRQNWANFAGNHAAGLFGPGNSKLSTSRYRKSSSLWLHHYKNLPHLPSQSVLRCPQLSSPLDRQPATLLAVQWPGTLRRLTRR
jgi:hypothetical protein